MAILLKSGALFFHIPKTGGNWVSDVLEKHHLVFAYLGGKHSVPASFRAVDRLLKTPQHYSKSNRDLYRFCFVRHPLRWYESWFKMNLPLNWPNWNSNSDALVPVDQLNGLGASSFGRFISNVLDRCPGFLTAMYDLYTKEADFVGKQEEMAFDLVRVLRFMNIGLNLDTVANHPRVNVSEELETRLDDKQCAAIEEAEFSSFIRYGYQTVLHRPNDTQYLKSIPSSLDHFERRTTLISPFLHNGGFAWTRVMADIRIPCDTEDHHHRSFLVLYEDGRPLAMPHSTHATIREQGQGRYSHWMNQLYFSTSDNTDPNTNGRNYEIACEYPRSHNDPAILLVGR